MATLCADTTRTGHGALDQLAEAVATLDGEPDPWRVSKIAGAAHMVHNLEGCHDTLWRVVQQGRTSGTAGQTLVALNHLGFEAIRAGHWATADALAAEGLAQSAAAGKPHGGVAVPPSARQSRSAPR